MIKFDIQSEQPLPSEKPSEKLSEMMILSRYSRPALTLEEIEAERQAAEEAKRLENVNWTSLKTIDYKTMEELEITELIGAEILHPKNEETDGEEGLGDTAQRTKLNLEPEDGQLLNNTIETT